MPGDGLEEWVMAKVEIARKINSGGCGGGYAEAVLILCGVISAIAADRWPGKNKDKKRFIELLISYADSSLNTATISVPLLASYLDTNSKVQDAIKLRETFLPRADSRVVTGVEVDTSEQRVADICPCIKSALTRQYSYAALLYVEARSSYVHEYQIGKRADSWAWVRLMLSGESVILTVYILLQKESIG